MKKLLLILLCLPFIGFGQHTAIPDKVFEETLINLGYDTVLDGKVLTDNIIGVKSLEFNGLQNWPPVSDFTGIQNFTALEQLSVLYINLKSIDFLSNNKELTYLSCKGNELTNIDLTNNKKLTYLNCESNQLTNLDLTSNKLLTYLNCEDNQLTNLDLRNNSALVELSCDRDQLKNVNLGNNNSVKINEPLKEKERENEAGNDANILFYFLVFLITFTLVTLVWYMMKPKCPKCKKKVFKNPEVLDTKYTDTTPRKKDGTHDRRYNKSGYWSKLKKWTCNCGYSWQKWV